MKEKDLLKRIEKAKKEFAPSAESFEKICNATATERALRAAEGKHKRKAPMLRTIATVACALIVAVVAISYDLSMRNVKNDNQDETPAAPVPPAISLVEGTQSISDTDFMKVLQANNCNISVSETVIEKAKYLCSADRYLREEYVSLMARLMHGVIRLDIVIQNNFVHTDEALLEFGEQKDGFKEYYVSLSPTGEQFNYYRKFTVDGYLCYLMYSGSSYAEMQSFYEALLIR